VHINIGADTLSANPNITQLVDVCDGHGKISKFLRLMEEIFKEGEGKRIIVFADTKRMVDELTRTMRENG